jgi:purine-binding chemotaxis protein CheW
VTINATTPRSDHDHPAPVAGVDASFGATDLLLCRAGRQLHAIPIEYVREIMRAPPIEQIAGAPVSVLGVCVIRGTPVPVVDVGLLVHTAATQAGRLISLRVGDRRIALAVDAVLGIRRFDAGAFSQLPPLLCDAAGETVSAIGAKDAELMFALRAARIVPDSVFDELERDGGEA